MKAYTLGFIFNHDLTKVLLMHKQRPGWQVGKLNGIGGRIEPNEKNIDCIVREVIEETGVSTKKENWTYFGEIKSDDWRVDLYTLKYSGNVNDFSTTTDEKIEWFKINNLPYNIIANLSWILPLAIYGLKNNGLKKCSVEYFKIDSEKGKKGNKKAYKS